MGEGFLNTEDREFTEKKCGSRRKENARETGKTNAN